MLPLSELPFASALTLVTRAAHRAARRPFQIPLHHLRRRSGKQGLSVPAGQGPWSRTDTDPGTGVPPKRRSQSRTPQGSSVMRRPLTPPAPPRARSRQRALPAAESGTGPAPPRAYRMRAVRTASRRRSPPDTSASRGLAPVRWTPRRSVAVSGSVTGWWGCSRTGGRLWEMSRSPRPGAGCRAICRAPAAMARGPAWWLPAPWRRSRTPDTTRHPRGTPAGGS